MGRAQTMSTTSVRTGKFAHIRVGRRGDFQPHFHGVRSGMHSGLGRPDVFKPISVVANRLITPMSMESGLGQPLSVPLVLLEGLRIGGNHVPLKFMVLLRPWIHGIRLSCALLPASLKPWLSKCVRWKYSSCPVRANMHVSAVLRNPNVLFRDLKTAPSNGVDYLLRPLTSMVQEVRRKSMPLCCLSPNRGLNRSRLFVVAFLCLSFMRLKIVCG